jgi:hypothetical protein
MNKKYLYVLIFDLLKYLAVGSYAEKSQLLDGILDLHGGIVSHYKSSS